MMGVALDRYLPERNAILVNEGYVQHYFKIVQCGVQWDNMFPSPPLFF